MRKIPTIFDRDYTGKKHYVIDKPMATIPPTAMATEKLDGTNVRCTVRSGTCVRLEKRRNPSREQKKNGITEPWYVDADEQEYSANKYIFEALRNTSFEYTKDGEYSGEAIGPKIQGNPLGLKKHQIYLFEERMLFAIKFDVPTLKYEDLRDFLKMRRSFLNTEVGIEGIVWWYAGQPVGKIKTGDFE